MASDRNAVSDLAGALRDVKLIVTPSERVRLIGLYAAVSQYVEKVEAELSEAKSELRSVRAKLGIASKAVAEGADDRAAKSIATAQVATKEAVKHVENASDMAFQVSKQSEYAMDQADKPYEQTNIIGEVPIGGMDKEGRTRIA